MKNPNLDNLTEEELQEYLAKNSDEDLKADDDGGPREEKQEAVQIAAQIEMPAPKKRVKLASKEEKAKKKADKEKQKQIRKHRRYLKKHPSTLVRYEVDPKVGLTDEIAEQRVIDELTNKVKTKSSRPVAKIIFKNVVTFFNILIFAIAGCLIAVGAPFTDFVFLVIVSFNIVIGIVQEINAKNMIDKLSLMSAPTAFVIRSGVEHEIGIEDVVLDDCILLENGRQICADSILIEGTVEVNESLLTGESDAILKQPGDPLYSGSYVVSGKCAARVDKVGKDNYIEKLSSQAKQFKVPKSDLYGSLKLIIRFMFFPVVICGGFLFFVMFYKNHIDLTTSVRKTAGAMIGMIPSGLFLMSTIALYVGVIRLGQRNVLVQDLYCIEMLARVDCICLDKTGTITDGTMVVKNVIDYNNVHGLATRNIISAMLNALQDNNMTSQALKQKFGLGKRIRHTAKIPFSSSRKFQAVTFDKYGTFILGAPEFVLKKDFKRVEKDVNKYAALGYRVLCLAHKEGTITDIELPEGPIEIIAMILIEDNIRPDAISTIKYFHESGVEVRVISGDNPITVSKIAGRAGVLNADRYASLDGKSDSDVINEVRKGTTVFGRVSPEQKRLIINTLKDLGKTVAMTGDGVNDILALKEADCSIAVASGSQAVRNCSHLVLMDSNFDSMPSVVSEGRRVINNVSKVAALFLTKTIFSLFLAIEALVTGSYPIATSQLIIIESCAIGIPSLVLVNEPNNRPVKGKFLANVIREALPGALVILMLSVVVFGLSTELNLDNITLSSIIVIAATHTCMMVLFKVCRPFNSVHKALCGFCYSVFILAIVAVPQFLELRPIFSFTEYMSKSASTKYLAEYPSVSRSGQGYYVFGGKVLDLQKRGDNQTDTITAKVSSDGKTYYAINGTKIDYEMIIPNLSYSADGTIYVGGYEVTNGIRYSENLKFTVDDKGLLYCNGDPVKIKLEQSNEYYNYSNKYADSKNSVNYKNLDETDEKSIVQYCVLPTVTVVDGKYVINGDEGGVYKYKVPESLSLSTEINVSVDPQSLALLINGERIYATNTNTNKQSETPYTIELPHISSSCKDSTIYLDAVNSGWSIFEMCGTVDTTPSIAGIETLYTITDDTGKTYSLGITPQVGDELAEKKYFINNTLVETMSLEGLGYNGFKKYKDSTDTVIDVNAITLQAKNDETNYFIAYGQLSEKTQASLVNTSYCPGLDVTVVGHYIIDGYYTEYEFSSSELNPHLSQDNHLILGGITTDYVVRDSAVVSQTGVMVKQFTTTAKIFLLMLCLLAGPLMRLLENCVPWIVKKTQQIRGLLTKIQ